MPKTEERVTYPNELGMVREALSQCDPATEPGLHAALMRTLSLYTKKSGQAHDVVVVDADRPKNTDNTSRRQVTMASEKQVNFITSLIDRVRRVDAGVAEAATNWLNSHRDSLTAELASKGIASLKRVLGLPVDDRYTQHANAADLFGDKIENPEPALATASVEVTGAKKEFRPITLADGYYAVVIDGKTHFFRVSTYEWAGQTRRKMQEQASDSLFKMRWPNALHTQDLIIAAGVEASQMLYAQELGQCFICGRTLTDDESRARGMGPTCARKM